MATSMHILLNKIYHINSRDVHVPCQSMWYKIIYCKFKKECYGYSHTSPYSFLVPILTNLALTITDQKNAYYFHRKAYIWIISNIYYIYSLPIIRPLPPPIIAVYASTFAGEPEYGWTLTPHRFGSKENVSRHLFWHRTSIWSIIWLPP